MHFSHQGSLKAFRSHPVLFLEVTGSSTSSPSISTHFIALEVPHPNFSSVQVPVSNCGFL